MRTFTKTLVLGITFFLASLSGNSTTASDHANITTNDGSVLTEYWKIAMIHQWSRNDDYVTPTALLKAAVMARNGQSKDDIISAITQLRAQHAKNERAGLRRDWQVSEDYKTMIRHVGGLAGVGIGAYGKLPGLSNVTEFVTDLGIMTYETLARDKKVIQASRALGTTYHNVAGAEKHIADYVGETWLEYSVLQEVFSEQFAPILRVSPNDTFNEINQKLPHLLLHTNVSTILEIVSNRTALSDDEIETLTMTTRDIFSDVRMIRQQRQTQTDHAIQKARDRITRESLRSGAFIAATALGYVDPDLGRHFQAISSAAFQMDDAITNFRAAVDLSEDLTGAASLTLTANYIGAALTVVSAFGNTGPTPEQIILQEIMALRQDVRNLRFEMHNRFGIVERRMAIIYSDLDATLKDLVVMLQRQNRTLEGIVTTLRTMQNQISASTSLLLDRSILLEEMIAQLEIGDCVKWKQGVIRAMSADKFTECLFDFQALFAPTYLESRQISQADGGASIGLERMLREHPNEMISVSINSLDDFGGYDFPELVIGPSDWEGVATLYLNFLEDWPEHRALVHDGGLNLDTLASGGMQVAAVRSAVQAHLLSFGSGQADNAIHGILSRVTQRKRLLDEAIVARKDEYRSEVFDLYVPKIDPIRDKERCAFHQAPTVGFAGSGYIATLPRYYERLVPALLKQLLFAGIGRAEYCLELFYERGRKQRSSLEMERPSIMLARLNRGIVDLGSWQSTRTEAANPARGIWLADTEGIQYHMDAGPYTMRLRIDYIADSPVCDAVTENGAIPFAEFAAVDSMKLGGNISFYGTGWPPLRVVAERKIWGTDWRDTFVAEAVLTTNEAGNECVRKNSASRLEERSQVLESNWIANRISDPNDIENRILREADEDTEIDYALISHWIWSGFGDAAEKDDLLARLVLGIGNGPTLVSTVESTLFDEKLLVSEAPNRFSWGLKELSEVLRSEEILSAYAKSDDNFQVDQLMGRIDAMRQ